MEDSPITFASGLVRYYPANQLITCGNHHIDVPEKQQLILEPLAQSVGELVLTDELIDKIKPDIVTSTERYQQRLRVQSYILGLRKNFDRLLDGLGNPYNGVILNEYGRGYILSKHWTPLI